MSPAEIEPTAPSAGAMKEQLNAMAISAGALIFGVADAGNFDAAPEGYRPEDILPGARSIVVVGGAKPRAGDWREQLEPRASGRRRHDSRHLRDCCPVRAGLLGKSG